MQPAVARDGVGALVQLGRKARFVAAEPDADHAQVAQPDRLARDRLGTLGPEVAGQVGDQGDLDPQRPAGLVERRADRLDGRPDVELAVEERPDRRRDEDLGVDDALRRRVGDVVARDQREVFGPAQRLAHFGEQEQELAEGRERVRPGRIGPLA